MRVSASTAFSVNRAGAKKRQRGRDRLIAGAPFVQPWCSGATPPRQPAGDTWKIGALSSTGTSSAAASSSASGCTKSPPKKTIVCVFASVLRVLKLCLPSLSTVVRLLL